MLRKQAEFWFDRNLVPGDEFERVIKDEIDQADLVILLVSPGFMASDFIEKVELPRIIQRGENDQLVVIPVLLEPTDWQDLPFLSVRQMLPGQPTPLIDYTESEKQWSHARKEILDGIKRQVERIISSPSVMPTSTLEDGRLTRPDVQDKGGAQVPMVLEPLYPPQEKIATPTLNWFPANAPVQAEGSRPLGEDPDLLDRIVHFLGEQSKLATTAVTVTLLFGIAIVVFSLQADGCRSRTTRDGGHRPSAKTPARTPVGMVYIPAGRVLLGANEQQLRSHGLSLETIKMSPDLIEQFVVQCRKENEEVIQVDGFWIDQYEVTNAEYAKFVASTGHPPPPHWNGARPPEEMKTHPVTHVTYHDAVAYAAWAGKMLPTIAQWTRAYRGDDDRMYPWGSEWRSDLANVSQNTAFPKGTSSITSSPSDVTRHGVFNMVGNVSEILRNRKEIDGQQITVTKGADAECLGDIYGAAPFQTYLVGEGMIHRLTGFRCVIEADDPQPTTAPR